MSQRFDFSDLLIGRHIDLKTVLVFRRRPNEPMLRNALPWLAAEDHGTFNAYQQTQSPRVERAMLKARYVASFFGHEPSKAVFIGLYKIGASKPLSRAAYWPMPANIKLKNYDYRDFLRRTIGPRSFGSTFRARISMRNGRVNSL